LWLIYRSYSTLIGNNEVAELRLKYIELWLFSWLEDLWEAQAGKA
jgi:hypothetical protein